MARIWWEPGGIDVVGVSNCSQGGAATFSNTTSLIMYIAPFSVRKVLYKFFTVSYMSTERVRKKVHMYSFNKLYVLLPVF
jgi:hypothetical protein